MANQNQKDIALHVFLIAFLFHGSAENCVFAKAPAFNLSEAAPTNLAIEKLNTCERAVWR